jgi:hypothetical protein
MEKREGPGDCAGSVIEDLPRCVYQQIQKEPHRHKLRP